MDKLAFPRCSLLTREKEESVLQVAVGSKHVSAKTVSFITTLRLLRLNFLCVSGHRAVVRLLRFRHRNTYLVLWSPQLRPGDALTCKYTLLKRQSAIWQLVAWLVSSWYLVGPVLFGHDIMVRVRNTSWLGFTLWVDPTSCVAGSGHHRASGNVHRSPQVSVNISNTVIGCLLYNASSFPSTSWCERWLVSI